MFHLKSLWTGRGTPKNSLTIPKANSIKATYCMRAVSHQMGVESLPSFVKYSDRIKAGKSPILSSYIIAQERGKLLVPSGFRAHGVQPQAASGDNSNANLPHITTTQEEVHENSGVNVSP